MKYFDEMLPILHRAIETQTDTLKQAALLIADTIAADRLVYAFGAGHAGILAEEICYRAGGFVPCIPLLPPGLTVSTRPLTLESQMERMPGYGALILKYNALESGSVLILHSNSGRNTVTIEMGETAREMGIKVIAVVNVAQCNAVVSRHPKGLRLTDVADIVIDNCGVFGDACVKLDGIEEAAGSTSTVVGAALLNAVMTEAAQILVNRGVTPPIFRSANVDGNDDSNQKWMDHYGRRLLYL